MDAKFIAHDLEEEIVEHILLDSRQTLTSRGTLFFAIPGEQHDAHEFIAELIQNGVQNFVVSQSISEEVYAEKSVNILQVEDSIRALQKLAAYHRKQFDFTVIGITGSNGKTIVKEWLFQLLDARYKIVRSPKSYNSQIGVPLSVWQMQKEHQLGIFEAGISQPNEMEHLEKIIRPNIGILTNIGYAHAEGFENKAQKLQEKLKLFENAEVLICQADDELINEGLKVFNAKRKSPLKIFSWGENEEATVQIKKIERENVNAHIELEYDGDPIAITIPFNDDASIENAITCAVCGIYIGLGESFFRSFEQLSQVAMRLELKDAVNNCSLINDSYNSDLGSLKIALDFLKQQEQHARKSLVLSDILQSGMLENYLIDELLRMIHESRLHRFIAIGPLLYRNRDAFGRLDCEMHFYNTTNEFLADIQHVNFKDESILLKGARSFHFEKISQLLERKFHETVFEIDLNAVSNNLAVVRNHLADKTKIMAMVKAFSYGSGPYEIANMLQYHRVDYLAVAYVDEGVALRNAGITLPILVLNPDVNSLNSLVYYKLEPEVYSFRMLNRFLKELKENEYPEKLPLHIKIDTGMHRLGFLPEEMDALAKQINGQKQVYVASILSHLSSSEDPKDDVFTKKQIAIFKQAAESLENKLGYEALKHILNSSGTARFPEGKMDMVRVGLVLYGLDITGILSDKLQVVGQLKTTISQIKTLEKGETIGYNRKHKVESKMRVATIAIGYADGYRRSFGNGKAYVLVGNKKAPVIGNVCMDMSMIDVTEIPEVKEGDEVMIFGKDLPVEELASWAETIPYEILTGIGERVKRVYYKE